MLVRAWFILIIAERFGYINSIWSSINATGKINPHRRAPPHPSWNLLTDDKLCLSTPLVEKDRVEAADEQTSSVFSGRRTNLMASPIPKEVPRHNWWLEVSVHSCISNGVKMSQSPPQSSAWSPIMSRLPVQRGHPIAFENMGIQIRTQGQNCSVDGSSSGYPCSIPCHRWRPC